jgi:hypothetical protein
VAGSVAEALVAVSAEVASVAEAQEVGFSWQIKIY